MKYIDAEKLLDIVIKMQKEYATQEVTEEHKGLKAVLGGQCFVLTEIIRIIDSLQQEPQEVDLEKFTEKMDDWKARFNRPDDIPIKATMAFTARMFYMYPKVAREWYESLPKATQD